MGYSSSQLVAGGVAALTVLVVAIVAPFAYAIIFGTANATGNSMGVTGETAWTNLGTAITNVSTMFGTGQLGLIGLILLGILLGFLGIKISTGRR